MKFFFLLAGSLIFLSGCASHTETKVPLLTTYELEPEPVKTLAVGAVQSLDFNQTMAPNPLVGNKSILEVQLGSNSRQFRIIPLHKGTTDVIFYGENGKLVEKTHYNVVSNEFNNLITDVRRMLRHVEGITVDAYGDHIVIEGALLEPRDMDRILSVQEAYHGKVINLVTINPLVYEKRAQIMQKEINDDPGAASVVVKFINGTYFLIGQVDDDTDRSWAETIVQTYLPEIMGSHAIKENVLLLGAKKYSIRNMLFVKGRSAGRLPANSP